MLSDPQVLVGTDDAITQKIILQNDVVSLSIYKSEVEDQDLKRLHKVMGKFEDLGIPARGKLAISFNGYDDVPEEVYEIEPIRKWVSKAFKRYPYLFYFLSDYFLNNRVLLICLVNFEAYSPLENGRRQTALEYLEQGKELPNKNVYIDVPQQLKETIVLEAVKYAKRLKDDSNVVARMVLAAFGQSV